MPRSASGKSARSARSAHTSQSARSAYSTASHLLSPGGTNESLHSDSSRPSIAWPPSYRYTSSPTPSRPRTNQTRPSQASFPKGARITSPYWEDKNPVSPPSLLTRRDEPLTTASTTSTSQRPRRPRHDPPDSVSQRFRSVRSTLSSFDPPRSSRSKSDSSRADIHPWRSQGRSGSGSDLFKSKRAHQSEPSRSSRSHTFNTPNKPRTGTFISRGSSSTPSRRSAVKSNGSVPRRCAPARSVSTSSLPQTEDLPRTPSWQSQSASPRSPGGLRSRNVTKPHRKRLPSAARSSQLPDSVVLGAHGFAVESSIGIDQQTEYDWDILHEIIMAIDMNKDGKVGCAYYCAIDETLYLEEDIAMGGIETVETLLVNVEPTSLFIPNRASGALVEFVERDAHRFDDGETINGNYGSYILRHLTSAQFDYEVAKEIMAELDFDPYERGSVRTESTEEDAIEHICSASHTKLMRLAKMINLDSCLSIGCAGAVLTDLERRRTAENPNSGNEGNTPFRIRAIVMNYSEDTMLLSADSLMSLQITQSELHPNPYSQCPNGSEPTAKGSLSVIALIQSLASTAQGKRRLRQILLRPSTNINLIQERQTSIGILLRPENAEVTKDMRKLLRKLKDNKALLLHVRKGIDKVRGRMSIRIRDWEALLRFVMIAVNLYDAAGTLYGAEEVTIFAKIRQEVDVSNFIALSRDIMATFDFQASKDSGHTQILPTASELLEILREQYAEVLDLLPQLRDAQREEIPLWAHKHILGCSLMHGFGFVILVTPDLETNEGMYFGHDGDEWEKILMNEKAVIYRTRYTRELDSQYGDLLQYIDEEEMYSVLDLAYKVLEHEESILHALELYGELDSLLAFAAAAEKYHWVAPRMTTANVIDIDEGRHPLQELLVPVFIPNGCGLKGGEGRGMPVDEVLSSETSHNGEEKPSLLILTGPNNSGKSIYMKQVALIVYLAHTGSFVPAKQATIGMTDRILTRIATRETAIAEESAFMADVTQAAFSMNFSTRQSLLLIDEFGKGTTASNGATLLTAYLMYFLKLGAERPKILVGTHFHEIFENDLLQEQQGVALAHMEVRLDRKAEDIEDQITFLHRLLPGRGPKSLGIMCAELNGIPPHILDRAEDMAEFMEGHGDLMVAIDLARRQEIERRASLFIKRLLGIRKAEFNKSGHNVRELLREVLEVKCDDNEASEDEAEAEAEENYGADWGNEEDEYAEDMGEEAYYDESVGDINSEYCGEHEYDEAEAMEEDSQDDNGEETSEFIDDSLSSENGMECDEIDEELRQASESSEFNGFGSLENYGGLRNSGSSKHFGQNAQEDVGVFEEYEIANGRTESEGFGSSSGGDGIEDDDAEDLQESGGVMDWSPSMCGAREAEDSPKIQDNDDIEEIESFEEIEGFRDIRRFDGIESYEDIQSSEDDHDSEDVEGSENIHGPQGLEAAQYDEDLEEYEDSEIFEGFEETEGSTDFEGFGSSLDVQVFGR